MKYVNKTEKRTYVIEGEPEHMNRLEKVLFFIQYLGDVGSSRNIIMFVDGDGAVRLKITKENGKLQRPEDNDWVGTIDIKEMRFNPDDLYVDLE